MAPYLVHLCQSMDEGRLENRRIDYHLRNSSSLLAGLTAVECNEIFAAATPRRISKGRTLYSQGDLGESFLLIQSGVVKINQRGRDGTPVILWLIGAGDCLGIHHVSDYVHACSAEAIEDCRFVEWSTGEILRLCILFPRLSLNIDQMVTKRIHQLEERFTEIATEKVAQRVALLLIRLEQVIGKRTREGVELVLKREELAQMIGASIFSVSRLLADWSDSGIVVARRRAIVITDLSRVKLAAV